MFFPLRFTRTSTILLIDFFFIFSIYTLSFFPFIFNTPEVSSFRVNSPSCSIAKSHKFLAFGSKRRASRLLEEDSDTAVPEEVLDRLHEDCKAKLKSIEDYVRAELSKIYDHRAAPSLIEHVYIDTDSGKRQLRRMASIVTRGNFELVVNPFSKNDLKDIFTSLSTQLRGYTVKLLENFVSVNVPQIGSDMKKKTQESVKRLLNTGIDQIRMARQNTMKALKALESGLSDDMVFAQKAQIEGHVKSSTSAVEKMCNDKLASLN